MKHKKDKKIGILTLYYKNANYGAILQAYALQKALERMGYDAKQISYVLESGNIKFSKIKQKMFFLLVPYLFIKQPIWSMHNWKLKKGIYKFAKLIPHTSVVTKSNIKRLNNRFDVFICGSDQIWNPIGWQPTFFLDFVSQENTKISYASSVARDILSKDEINFIKKYIQKFNAISVREEKSANLLRREGIAVEVMPDPTFLLEKNDWEGIVANRLIKEDYIFAYFLGSDIMYREAAIAYANIHKKKIVFIPFMQRNVFDWEKKHKEYMVENVGVTEFLSLIKYADAVITDSFHGTVFSIIFEKSFYNLERFMNDDVNSMNSRLETLFDGIQIGDRKGYVLPEKIQEFTEQEIINIQNYQIERRKIGLSFLESALNEETV